MRLTFLLQRLHDFSGAEAASSEAFWQSLVAVSIVTEVKELAAKILHLSEAAVTEAARFSHKNERQLLFFKPEQREFFEGPDSDEDLAWP